MNAPQGMESHDRPYVLRLGTGETTTGAPGLLRVVRVLLFLDPDLRLRKHVGAIDVVRVHVREYHARDLVGLDSQALKSLIRPREIGDAEALENLLPIEARIDQDCPTGGAFQHPEGHREVDRPSRVGALHE